MSDKVLQYRAELTDGDRQIFEETARKTLGINFQSLTWAGEHFSIVTRGMSQTARNSNGDLYTGVNVICGKLERKAGFKRETFSRLVYNRGKSPLADYADTYGYEVIVWTDSKRRKYHCKKWTDGEDRRLLRVFDDEKELAEGMRSYLVSVMARKNF